MKRVCEGRTSALYRAYFTNWISYIPGVWYLALARYPCRYEALVTQIHPHVAGLSPAGQMLISWTSPLQKDDRAQAYAGAFTLARQHASRLFMQCQYARTPVMHYHREFNRIPSIGEAQLTLGFRSLINSISTMKSLALRIEMCSPATIMLSLRSMAKQRLLGSFLASSYRPDGNFLILFVLLVVAERRNHTQGDFPQWVLKHSRHGMAGG